MTTSADFKSLIRPLPAGVKFSEEAPEGERMDAGEHARLTLVGAGEKQDVFGIWLAASTIPWLGLLYPDGSPIICRGVRIAASELSWSPNGGVTTYTSLCPEGPGSAGAGWHYRFCPRYTLVVGIGGIQCSNGDLCGNPRDVYSQNGRAGQLTVAFNDSSAPGAYNDNTGGCRVLIHAVYQ